MRHKITAGGEIDVLNQDELREVADELADKLLAAGEEPVRPEESGVTDANGNCIITVYQPPIGFVFRITRLVVEADGFTFAVPFRNAAGAIHVLRSGKVVDGVNLGGNGLPAISTDNRDTGARWRNGELVQVQFIGGPANTTVQATAMGFVYRAGGDPAAHPGRLRQAAVEVRGQEVAP